MFTRTTKKSLSRQDAKSVKKRCLSFRPKREIFLRSLAFARDDGPRPVLACFASLRELSFFQFCNAKSSQKEIPQVFSGPPHHGRCEMLDRRRADLLHDGAQLDAQELEHALDPRL